MDDQRQELTEGEHTVVIDSSAAVHPDPTTLFSVPKGYFIEIVGLPVVQANGSLAIKVRVTGAGPT